MDWESIYKRGGTVQSEVMPVVKEFLAHLGRNNRAFLRILDVGCGTGRHSLFISEGVAAMSKNLFLVSFDSSQTAIDTLTKRVAGRENVKVSLRNLGDGIDYPNLYFDGIISTLVIEHSYAQQRKKWCLDMQRVLKREGLLALAVPSINDFRYKEGRKVEHGTKIDTNQLDGDLPHHFFEDGEVEGLFRNYNVLYKKQQEREAATAKGNACHWEYLLQKP